MEFLIQIYNWLIGSPELISATLSFAAVKRFKPQAGIKMGLLDLTFDDQGPTWTVTKAMLGLAGGILKLILPAHIGEHESVDVPVAGHQTVTISAREEADGGTAMQAIDAGDLNTKVVRVMYIGY